MNIGLAIRTLRKQKNLSQVELSKKCGVTQTAISQIENVGKNPGRGTLEKLCKAMNCSKIDIYILSMEESDFPVAKRAKYKLIYPTIKAMVMDLTK